MILLGSQQLKQLETASELDQLPCGMPLLSRAEFTFVAQGIAQDIRQDGRTRLEYRHISAERSVLPLAHGSARVSLANGETEVLASVKLELGAS